MPPAYTYDLPSQPVAQGGQGAVYFAARSDGFEVAIKVPTAGKRSVEAIEREIALLRRLEAAGVEGVVRCLDVITVDDLPAMVMPRYPRHLGQWLQDAIRSPEPDTLIQVFETTAALARILESVHRVELGGQRIVHRDVKPENVFVEANGTLALGDFGGAMTIDGLRPIELALFGTPMWAPLDQILPGQAIPDPTWDTYALCVMLYALITGARPAYQSDPRELLTAKGQALWELAREAIAASGEPRRTLKRDFARGRVGSRPEDLVDLTGRAALNDADREVLAEGLVRLCALAGAGDPQRKKLERGLWNLLVRGLSPLSHPSPPNRFRSGTELAEALEDLRSVLLDPPGDGAREATRAGAPPSVASPLAPPDLLTGPMPAPHVSMDPRSENLEPQSSFPSVPTAAAAVVIGTIGLAAFGSAAWWLASWFGATPAMVSIEGGRTSYGGQAVELEPFLVDRTEVTVAGWERCTASGACAKGDLKLGPPDTPVVGLTAEDARAYCAFRRGRLLTHPEWLYVQGEDAAPWGNVPATCDHAIALGCGDTVAAVGHTPAGRSRHGLWDLAGNAWEWVLEPDGDAVLVGGGVESPASQLGRSGRMKPKEGQRWPTAGVRCGYDP